MPEQDEDEHTTQINQTGSGAVAAGGGVAAGAGGMAIAGNVVNSTIIFNSVVSDEKVVDLENLPPEPGEPPYQGLQYFDEHDAGRFFGREGATSRVIGRLQRTRFLAVVGASGSGKSSLLRAGVIPALRSGARLADGSLPPSGSPHWAYRVFTPGGHPLDSLAAALSAEGSAPSQLLSLRDELAASPASLAIAAQALLARENSPHLLLVVDQMEEAFSQARDAQEREAFFDALVAAANPDDSRPLTILVCLRADFYAHVAQHERLRELVSQHQEFIGAMGRAELVDAIVAPLDQGGWSIQEGLVKVILDDVGYEPGALPLLSHALLETWKRRRGRTLTLSGYVDCGGVRGAIRETADAVFRQRLTPAQQPIARTIFLHLAELNEDAQDTRRRASFSELITRSTDEATIQAVLDILVEARLVTADTVDPGGQKVVQVAHESLIREWPTLREWLDQDRQGLILHRQLTEDTNEWLKLERDPGGAYRGARLKQALDWAAANPDLISLSEGEFLDASREISRQETDQKRRLGRARAIQAALAAAAALLVVVVLVIVLALNGVFAPRKMGGAFNIAVAEFGEMRADGKIYPSRAGRTISGWTASLLRDQLKGDSTIEIWPKQGNIFNRTRVAWSGAETDEGQAASAEAVAKDIKASLILYGYVDTTQHPPQLVLRFTIPPQSNYGFEDAYGTYSVGEPIRIADLDNPGTVRGDLQRQSSAIAWIGIGLTNEQLGQSNDALEAFLSAGEVLPESKVVQFFIGREYLFASVNEPQGNEADWQAAEDALQMAVAGDKPYARAYIPLGTVYFNRSAKLLQTAVNSNQAADPRAEEWLDEAIRNYRAALDLHPDAAEYGNPVGNVASLALGNAYRLKGSLALYQGDPGSALEAEDKAISTVLGVLPAFEASTQEHETHRRYLAQAYEYLGEAYQWQGAALQWLQEYPAAREAYENSLVYYGKCTAQADLTLDLVIKDYIVPEFCQAYSEAVQKSLDNLSGGQ